MMDRSAWLVVFLVSATVTLAKDTSLNCGACHMLVDEIQWEIAQTDPKKTIEVGSFRINPDGTQKLSEIPYARSGIQITELLENVCTASNQYIQTDQDGMKIYVRQNSRHGKPVHLKKAVISSDNNKRLKFACESFAEDFEDEIMDIFKANPVNLLKELCADTTEVCGESELYDVNTPAQEMEDLFEKAEKHGHKDDEDEDDESDDDSESDDGTDSEDENELVDSSSAAPAQGSSDPSRDEL